jgi:D-lactate dehydrogenase (cytochrome)
VSGGLRTAERATRIDDGIAHLKAVFGNRLVTSDEVRTQHGHNKTWIECQPPDAVFFPQSTDDVQAAVRICARTGLPVVPYGAGSSVEGGVNAPFGGISFDFRDMNRLLAVNPEDADCVVEPGITRSQLNKALTDHGLSFPIDPGADASLGGMASTRASGTTAVRYGTMKDNVISLKVVVADGSLLSTGRRARKSSAGYDLTRLFVGAEGTLGVITELTLKLHRVPQAVAAGICPFPSVDAACGAAVATIQAGIPVARMEFLDEVQVRACNLGTGLSLKETPTLFLEFHGTPTRVSEDAKSFDEVAGEFGGVGFEWATAAEERNRLWAARYNLFWANKELRPGAHAVVSDVCVPVSRLAECIIETKRDLAASGLIAPIAGHVGDGNFHCFILVMMNDAEEVSRVRGFLDRLANRALAMDGTCTGEHGVGQGKKHLLEPELGFPAVAAMRAIKLALDPGRIMNPDKVV